MPESKYRQQTIRAPRGTVLTAKSWLTEAPLRMLMNNLDPDVAENPHELVVYGGIGRAARNWECYDCSGTLKTRKRDSENTKNRFFVFYVSNRQFLAVF